MANRKLVGFGIALLGLAATVAHGQTSPVRPVYSFPSTTGGPAASVQVADTPLFFTPYIGFAYGKDDNLFQTPNLQRESNLYIVSPGVTFDARSENSVFQAGYQAQIGHYSDSENDNYVDHTTRLQLDTAFDRRNFLRLGYQYLHGHDPRGSTDRGITSQPDRFWLSTPSITYAFGAPGAAGRVEAYYSNSVRRYLNNPETTAAANRNTSDYGGTFYWRVAPRTYLLAEARRTSIGYTQPGSPSSSDETRYFGGVTWEATAATTGTFKVGRLEKKFKSDFQTYTGTALEALVTWAPLTYSRVDFFAARTANEASGLGNFIVTELVGVSWNHNWSSAWVTGVDLRYQKDDYQGFDRNDDVTSIGLKVGYKFRRWLTLGAEYTHTKRDSNLPNFDYDRNLYFLTANASL